MYTDTRKQSGTQTHVNKQRRTNTKTIRYTYTAPNNHKHYTLKHTLAWLKHTLKRAGIGTVGQTISSAHKSPGQ